MLSLTPDVLAGIIAHARREAPIEACGYLAERRDGVIDTVYPLTNADASPEHFRLLPAEQFAAVRAMRQDGRGLRAVYHSHPASPARMSDEDIRLAADRSLNYVIVSLAGPRPVVKAFTVGDRVEEVAITVLGRPAGEKP